MCCSIAFQSRLKRRIPSRNNSCSSSVQRPKSRDWLGLEVAVLWRVIYSGISKLRKNSVEVACVALPLSSRAPSTSLSRSMLTSSLIWRIWLDSSSSLAVSLRGSLGNYTGLAVSRLSACRTTARETFEDNFWLRRSAMLTVTGCSIRPALTWARWIFKEVDICSASSSWLLGAAELCWAFLMNSEQL